MRRLGVRHLRTGLSWADSYRPNAQAWFDRMMDSLAEFDVTVTFCFTPEHMGLAPQPHQPAAARRGLRGVLPRDDRALRGAHGRRGAEDGSPRWRERRDGANRRGRGAALRAKSRQINA